jgi:ABC-type lipoprotein export system ATPase subunit
VSTVPAITLAGVRKAFEGGRVPALRDISFEIAEREFVALTGASGSGKSTILNLIGALDTADAGTIIVQGQRLDSLRRPSEYRATTVGFVFQAHNLLPTLSASENVQVPMFGRLPRQERIARARELLGHVGLGDRTGSRPSVLSGGERQRVAIARALANRPKLLLADEPTGALDSTNSEQVIGLLQTLRELYGMTVLMVTNDDDMATHADRTLRLRDGLIRAEAPRSAPA